MRGVLSILAGALFLTSCMVNEHEVDPRPEPGPQEGMAEISFMAEMPAPKVVATRAVGSERENKVEDVYVMVFETGTDGDLVYKGSGRNVTVADGAPNKNKVTFKATLPVGTAYDLMVLANTGTALNSINVSSGTVKKSTVLALAKTLTTKWSATSTTLDPIPMWGELKNQNLTANSSVTFPLVRMLARVNVEYSPTNTLVNNFRLSSVRVYNYSTKGAFVPAAASLDTDGTTSKLPTTPTGGYGTPATTARNPLVYTDITGNASCEDIIYLFEAAHNGSKYGASSSSDAWIENPCLVIGGKWSADGVNWSANDTYYRVDFIKKTTEAGVTTEEWLSLLRNFSYNVTITEVSGEGYSDPDIALKSAPFNIEANVLPWNERNMEKVVFDGFFYLSVSQDEFVFGRREATTKDEEYETNVVRIKTDYLLDGDRTNAGSGWRVDRIVAAGTNTPVTWINLVPNARPNTWQPDDVDVAYFTYQTNPGPDNREADVWIKAGRLEYKVHILQKIMSLDVLDPSNAPIEGMSFIVPDAGTSGTEERPFKVTWTPSSHPVTITGMNQANGTFDPSWITGTPAFPAPVPYGSTNTPDTSTIAPQGGAVGEQSFTVKPEAVTSAMLAIDPFYETSTTYYFELENSGEILRDSINLTQVHYDIKADTHRYRLDGGVHTMTVRSNANWEIVSVEEHLFNSATPSTPSAPGVPIMIDFSYAYDNLKEGLHFGPNVNGTALSFHVVDNESAGHKDKWGFVRVGLKMTTPQGDTKTIYVDMMFPPASKLIMGLGYGLDVRSNNVAFGTPYHLHSAFRMLSSPYNFGSMDESVYKVDGLRILGYHANGESSATQNAIYEDFDWWRNSLVTWLNNDAPDVIVSSSFQTLPVIYNANECRLLKEYLENGGALIMMYNAGSGGQDHVARFMNAIFGGSYTYSANGTGANANNTDVKNWNTNPATGAVYQLASGPEFESDPILNGPFGDIRGLHWGTHFYRSGIKTSLIADKAITLSTAREIQNNSGSDEYSIIFRHKDYNLLFIGQDGFTSSYMEYYETREQNHDPFKTDVNNHYFPIGRPHFKDGTGPEYTVYNSVLLANAIAWALTSTNHQPPVGGYQNQ